MNELNKFIIKVTKLDNREKIIMKIINNRKYQNLIAITTTIIILDNKFCNLNP